MALFAGLKPTVIVLRLAGTVQVLDMVCHSQMHCHMNRTDGPCSISGLRLEQMQLATKQGPTGKALKRIDTPPNISALLLALPN